MTIQETISNIGKLIQDFCFTRADVHLSNLSHQGKAEIALQSNGVPWTILSNVLTYVDNVSMNTTASQSRTTHILGTMLKSDIMPPDGDLKYINITFQHYVTIPEDATTVDLCHIGVNYDDKKATFLVDNSSGSKKLICNFYDGTSVDLGAWTDGIAYGIRFQYDEEGYYKMYCTNPNLTELFSATVPENVSGNIYIDYQPEGINGWILETLAVGEGIPVNSTEITETTTTGNISFTGSVHALMPNGHAESHPGMCDSIEADITINSAPLTVSLGSSRKAVLSDPIGNISIADYVVSYSAPTGAVANDMWYDLSTNRLKKFTTEWTEWLGVKLGTLKYDEAGELIFTLAGAVQVPDFDTVMTEVELAKAPVGTVIAYMGTDEPEGYLLMDGRELSRTTYSRLFSVIGTTQGAGDGSTTFNIADMTDGRYLMGSTVAGGSGGAMAPLISGATRCVFSKVDMSGSGSLDNFHIEQEGGEDMRFNYINKGMSYIRRVTLNASRSSSIYGAGSTVRPINLSCKFFIRY